MKRIVVPIILVVIITLLMIAGPEYGLKLRNFLAPQIADNNSPSLAPYNIPGNVTGLAGENETLKAELAELQSVKAQLPDKPTGYMRALVYARVPLNFKSEFLINVGATNGAAVDRAVVWNGVLIGKVEKVYDDTSLVLTAFDSRFQAPVRIGTSATEALFKGGALPLISLIPAKSTVAEGDIIYASSLNFPYGLPIGEIESVKISADQLFKEASVKFAYNINSIATVFVAKK